MFRIFRALGPSFLFLSIGSFGLAPTAKAAETSECGLRAGIDWVEIDGKRQLVRGRARREQFEDYLKQQYSEDAAVAFHDWRASRRSFNTAIVFTFGPGLAVGWIPVTHIAASQWLVIAGVAAGVSKTTMLDEMCLAANDDREPDWLAGVPETDDAPVANPFTDDE